MIGESHPIPEIPASSISAPKELTPPQQEIAQKVAKVMGIPVSNVTLATSGADKLIVGTADEPGKVYMTARHSIMSTRLQNVKNEIKFTEWIGTEVATKIGSERETNIATNVTKVEGKSLWIMEKAEGDLEKKMRNVDFQTRLSYVSQVCNGMANLHKVNVVHGDIKPENFLVFPNGVVRVGDFGKGAVLDQGLPQTGYSGNPRFGPPENEKSKAGDVYGQGLVIIRILEEEFLKDNRTLMDESLTNKKDLPAHESRRGVEALILEHPSCKRACETKGTGFSGFVKCLRCRVQQKIGWNKEDLKAEKTVLNQYISILGEKLKSKVGEAKAEKLTDLLMNMTAVNPQDRPSSDEVASAINSLFLAPIKPEEVPLAFAPASAVESSSAEIAQEESSAPATTAELPSVGILQDESVVDQTAKTDPSRPSPTEPSSIKISQNE